MTDHSDESEVARAAVQLAVGHDVHGAFGDDPQAEFESSCQIEADLLTALMWAPRELAKTVVDVMLQGDSAESDRRPIRLTSPVHEDVLTAVAAVLATGAPAQPSLVLEQLRAAGNYRRVVERGSWLTLVSPVARPAPSAELLPHLAVQVSDNHYRRGYRALTLRMAQAYQELPVEELGGYWAQLTEHVQRAEADWLDRREALATVIRG